MLSADHLVERGGQAWPLDLPGLACDAKRMPML